MESTLSQMGQILAHQAWHNPEWHADEGQGGGLGRLGIGLFNPGPQPVWNDAHTIAAFMVGEIYEDELVGESQMSDEQRALEAYIRDGDSFASGLNGSFSIAVWDKTRGKIILTNDRFGAYQHYLLARQGKFIFSPEVKAILSCPTVRPELDLVAVAQYVRFQHLLGERTFWEEIALVPPASYVVYDLRSGETQKNIYWDFSHIGSALEIGVTEAAEETGRLLRKAVMRRSGESLRLGVYLSGGLDSRTLLGLVDRRPVSSVTYGTPGCLDVILAERIARKAGSSHHFIDLTQGDWVREFADYHLTLTEGFHSWVHAHGISTLDGARKWMDVNLTGWDGGSLLSPKFLVDPLLTHSVSDSALVGSLFARFNQVFTWPSIDEAEEALLYTSESYKKIRGVAFDSFREELVPYLSLQPEKRATFFYWRNHIDRLTHNMLKIYRSHFEVRIPYMDYELVDFVLALPNELRKDSILHREIIQREVPSLSLIPYENDEMLPTSREWLRAVHGLGVRMKGRINKHILPVFKERTKLYADYENYLRQELRPWSEGILFDRRTEERGLFSPDYLRTLMDRHLSGKEPWTLGKIAPLITLEMAIRRYVDQF